METLVLVVHILIAIIMIALILLQQGKGAEAGASFGGGASGTVFGGAGSATFITKMTAGLALVFFITSLGLAIYAKRDATAIDAQLAPGSQAIPGLSVPAAEQPVINPDLPVAPAQ